MSSWKKCDRCGALASPYQTSDWDTVKLGSSPNQVPRDLCSTCRGLLDNFLTNPDFGKVIEIKEPAPIAPPLCPSPGFLDPMLVPPVPHRMVITEPTVLCTPIETIEEQSMDLAPGPPIFIPKGHVLAGDTIIPNPTNADLDGTPPIRCSGDGRHDCGHLFKSHSGSGCMVQVKGEYCRCGTPVEEEGNDWNRSAKAEGAAIASASVPDATGTSEPAF